jgi:hypothetical protein
VTAWINARHRAHPWRCLIAKVALFSALIAWLWV